LSERNRWNQQGTALGQVPFVDEAVNGVTSVSRRPSPAL
jgi:hypothetical protein